MMGLLYMLFVSDAQAACDGSVARHKIVADMQLMTEGILGNDKSKIACMWEPKWRKAFSVCSSRSSKGFRNTLSWIGCLLSHC